MAAAFRSVCSTLLLSFICLLNLLSAPAAAQTDEDELWVEPAAGTPAASLPDPRDRSTKLLLSKDNVESHRGMLLAPLAEMTENGQFAARLFSRLDFDWQYAPAFEEQSRQNGVRYLLTPDNSIGMRADAGPLEGFPFGRARDIDQETDARAKAYKILWNTAAAEAAAGQILYELGLWWFGAQSVLRQSEGVFYRRFDLPQFAPGPAAAHALPSATPSPALETAPAELRRIRQEVLQLVSPPVVFGFAQISWRYADLHDDDVWIYSPVIGKTRRVLAANRSDPLLGGQLTFDDIFGWSTKVQAVEALAAAEKKMLVTFPALSQYAADLEDVHDIENLLIGPENEVKPGAAGRKDSGPRITAVRGYYQEAGASRAAVLWNSETRQFPAQPAWLPATAVMVPRTVWILELTPKEPLYSSGREVLVVDKESMLPVYKLVFDYAGQLQRIVIAGWSLAVSKDGKKRFPFCGFLLAAASDGREAMAGAARNVYLLPDAALAARADRLLDISAHGRGAKDAAAAKEEGKQEEGKAAKTPGKTPSPEAADSLPQPED